MNPLLVFAPEGRVPMERQLGWIGQEPVQVPDTYYYRQLLGCGALQETAPSPVAQTDNEPETQFLNHEANDER